MKIAIFSDIHGNITGVKKILSHLKKNGGSDLIIAAGDIIGGSSGTENLFDLLLQNGVILLKGNAEELYTDYDQCFDKIPFEARGWILKTNEWLHSKISKHYWDLMANLPINTTIRINDVRILVCHASPDDPWAKICAPFADEKDIEENYGRLTHSIVAYGHYHHHHVMTYQQKILINVASVGERTDGTSCYTLIEDIGKRIVIKQFMVAYNRGQELKLNHKLGTPDWS